MWKERMDIYKPRMDPYRSAEVGKVQKLVFGGTSVVLPAPPQLPGGGFALLEFLDSPLFSSY